jgi:molecular chaperone DnaJ
MQVQTACADCQGEGKTYAKKCSKCGGTGQVNEVTKTKIKIPAGINTGEAIRLSGQGEAGEKGVPAGDLYLKIRINPDKRFKRDGDNILSKADISFTLAALGGKVGVDTVDGEISLKIPEGTQSGTEFRLRGRGVPKLRGRGRGDHIVEVVVRTPTRLSRKQKELLRELEN